MPERSRILMFHSSLAERLGPELGGDFDLVHPTKGEDKLGWLESNGAGLGVAVFLTTDRVDSRLLDRLPDLRHIQIWGTSMAAVDLPEVRRRGISIDNAGRAQAGEIADHAVGLMIAARRNIVIGDHWVRRGVWQQRGGPGLTRSVMGSRVGIAGLGNIGSAIARRLEPFEVELGWWGPRDKPEVRWRRYGSLLEMAHWADILFVTVAADARTRRLIDREIIDAVGREGLLVNVSRGFVVDEEALVSALRDGRLAKAALDVFETEPTPAESWRTLSGVVLSPHVAGGTVNGVRKLVEHTVAALRLAATR